LKVGLILPLFSGDAGRVLAFARRAEELGYDGVFAFDHYFPPGASPDRPSLEAFTCLAAVGAITERVSVGTLVTRAQLRPAGLVAKMAANIDNITAGRMILGVGTGDPIDQPEHEAFGFRALDKRERRGHLAEALGAIKGLFDGRRWEGGRYVPAMDGPLLPGPIQPGGPPVWVGAQADEVVRLAGRLADGWNGWALAPREFGRKAKILEEEKEGGGRDAEATWAGIVLVGENDGEAERLLDRRRARGMPADGVWSGSADHFVEHLFELGSAGAAWTVLVPAGPGDRIELLAEKALPALRQGQKPTPGVAS
jgi:alkanesulfonate monooxygenase SsuD/methylene tetrahydromethanopterin reductase-like flavin-dependent oxidoreductase (luciferase family)